MFNLDAKVLARLTRHLQRVLVVDPNPAAAYLLADILKGLGAKRCVQIASTQRAIELCGDLNPQLIFSELTGSQLDGVSFTSRLRRSALPCRSVPVVIVSCDTREHSIRLARDAGAHEFLVKPFTALGVFRRVENVMLKPRPWVETDIYVGPDRRRFNAGEYFGRRRRDADTAYEAASAEETFLSADVEIRSELAKSDGAPTGAIRRMIEQTIRLQRAARTTEEDGQALCDAIEAFQHYLLAGIDDERLEPRGVVDHLNRIGALRQGAVARAAGGSEAPETVRLF